MARTRRRERTQSERQRPSWWTWPTMAEIGKPIKRRSARAIARAEERARASAAEEGRPVNADDLREATNIRKAVTPMTPPKGLGFEARARRRWLSWVQELREIGVEIDEELIL